MNPGPCSILVIVRMTRVFVTHLLVRLTSLCTDVIPVVRKIPVPHDREQPQVNEGDYMMTVLTPLMIYKPGLVADLRRRP